MSAIVPGSGTLHYKPPKKVHEVIDITDEIEEHVLTKQDVFDIDLLKNVTNEALIEKILKKLKYTGSVESLIIKNHVGLIYLVIPNLVRGEKFWSMKGKVDQW